ncbi:class C sortase [Ruminococcus sp.]|uniref:class C sortase n=1 Tax=Ruminococcus sp. TaxID=41978 RepID=UPI0038907DB8
MKRFLPIIIIALIFLIGLGVLCYPLVSSVINNIGIRNEAKVEYEKAENMTSDEVNALFAQAETYNKSLLSTIILTDPFDEEAYAAVTQHYEETFNVGDNGLIGFIDIPKINVYLPIYHGTSTEVLSRGAGHLENTAFPIGGKNTHSVISAHTAFPTETFFDYLTDLKEGDEFYIHVLNRVLTYQVDQIKVVLPDNTSDLYVEKDRDLVTLLTCTPYSINSHRLLVRGTRMPDKDPETVSTVSTGDTYFFFLGYKIPFVTAGVVIAAFLLFVGTFVFLLLRIQRKKKNHSPVKDGDHHA